MVAQLDSYQTKPPAFTAAPLSQSVSGVTQSVLPGIKPLEETPIGGGDGGAIWYGYDPDTMPEGDLWSLPAFDGGLGGDYDGGIQDDQGNFVNAGAGTYESQYVNSLVDANDPTYTSIGDDLNSGGFDAAVALTSQDLTKDINTNPIDIPKIDVPDPSQPTAPPADIFAGWKELTYASGTLAFYAAAGAASALLKMKRAPGTGGIANAVAKMAAVAAVGAAIGLSIKASSTPMDANEKAAFGSVTGALEVGWDAYLKAVGSGPPVMAAPRVPIIGSADLFAGLDAPANFGSMTKAEATLNGTINWIPQIPDLNTGMLLTIHPTT